MLDERTYSTQVTFGSCGILRQVSSKNCFGALLFKHLRLIEFCFWTDGLVLLVWLLQRSPFCRTKTTSLFLASFFFCRIEHSFGNGLKFCSLPFLTHIPLFNHCFLATNTTSGSFSLKINSMR